MRNLKNIEETINASRSAFLSMDFPNLPYCSFKRGPSTIYSESFHITNSNSKITLNFHWGNNGVITVQTHDGKEKNPYKKYSEKYRSKKINSKIAFDLCTKYLS
ncbi:MAG: hypothetical protein H6552_00225 [Chitinophagales bacterium]|nr:hypothetical protein [Chitinophagales bacterium]